MTFIDDNLKINNFHFFYVTELNKREHMPSGFIGLDLEKLHTFHSHSINFVDQLERNKYIEGFGITLIINKNNKLQAKILFGPDLDEIFESFENCKKIRIRVGNTFDQNYDSWGFGFDEIKMGGKKSRGYKATLTYDEDYIISTDEYSDEIMKVYFNELIKLNNWKLENITTISYYKYIKCDTRVISALERLLPLNFFVKDVNNDIYQLNFTYRELFEITNDAVFF